MNILDLLTGNYVTIPTNSVVIWPARVEPPHKAHGKYIKGLTDVFSHVIVVIGSANTHGTDRHCIPVTTRYKMLVAMLDEMKVDRNKYTIVPLDDFYKDNGNDPDDEKWYEEIITMANKYNADYIASGNEWIKRIIDEHPETGVKVIDPDLGIKETFRATDVRNAIIRGDIVALREMLCFSVLQMLLENDCYQGVIMANQKKAVGILHGRQTVDMVFLLKDNETSKLYVLLGKRKMDKRDFPGILALPGGAIEKYEFPNKAAARVFKEETGFNINFKDECFLDDPVTLDGINTSLLTMKMVGIYSSDSPQKAGTQGGSSQCFTVFIEDDVSRFREILRSNIANKSLKDLEELNFYEVDSVSNIYLAFQHNEMLEKAIYMSKARPKFEIDKRSENVNSKCICIVGSSGAGKSTAALGITFHLKACGISTEYTGEFAKDEVYENHLREILDDQSYILAMQNRRVKRLVDYGINYIISDSPLIITAYHAQDDKPIEELAYYLFDKTNNFIIFMNKDEKIKFETKARLEDEERSNKVSSSLKANLDARNYDYVETTGSTETIIKALEFVANDLEGEYPELATKVRKRIGILIMEKEMEANE